MNNLTIDINCDMAEGIGNEWELMPLVSSANIACGYHAGDKELMMETVALCLRHQVAIGAHPSFPDRENFGRTSMNLPLSRVKEIIVDQVCLLKEIAETQGGKLHHVKPHGALYNMAARDPLLSNCIAAAVKSIDANLILYGLSQSVMISEAEKIDLKTANEVFADRTYQPDGSLTPRTNPNALIQDEREAVGQALRLIKENKVGVEGGQYISLKADTLCLHGDGGHAVRFARLINAQLT
ncbi:MAG TPA: 5-oxoprolinase subunit PxpA, partial [Cyclobacteriaceae bacterium]|nr:5-oxoprolinase subunit PxpA [Cyclobacteriaceae bacterium]